MDIWVFSYLLGILNNVAVNIHVQVFDNLVLWKT